MKKGFTLIELLGVIILLGLVGLIVIPSITKLIKDSRQDLYENQVKMIEESARNWGVQNIDDLSETKKTYLSIANLIDSGFIEQNAIKDPRNNKDMDGCIVISYVAQSSKFNYVYNDSSCESINEGIDLTSKDPEYVCYNFNASTGTIVSYDKNNLDCPRDVIIPDKIDGVIVRHIGKAAFYQPSEQWCYHEAPVPINILYMMISEIDEDDVTEEEFYESLSAIYTNFMNYDIYDIYNETGYDEFPVSYDHIEGDGYDGCYYYGTTDNNKINSITIPSSIETIGDYAFMSNSIAELDLSNVSSLESIGEFAFSKNIINDLNLGDLQSIETIGSGAFSHNDLTSVDLSGLTNLKTLGKIGAARHLSLSQTSSEYPEEVMEFGFDLDQFTDANMQDVNEGSGVFENNLLESINLNDLNNMTIIGDYTFSSNNINTVDLRPMVNLNIIGKSAFSNNVITSINLENLNNLVEIKNGAFAFNSLSTVDLTTLTNLTHLGESEKPYFPYSYYFIAAEAGNSEEKPEYNHDIPYLYHCNYGVFETNFIDEISLPNDSIIEEIGRGAFLGNILQTFDFNDVPLLSNINIFTFAFNNLSSVYFSELDYLENIGMMSFMFNDIESIGLNGLPNLEQIGFGAFGYNNIESASLINLPNFKKIGAFAFANNGMDSLTLEGISGLRKIGNNAFQENNLAIVNLSGLTNLAIIEGYAFNNNNISVLNLNGLTNLEAIGFCAFEYNLLSSVTIPASVEYIGSYAFMQDSTWESVTIEYNANNSKTRFNDNWTYIGWPAELMPS